MLGSHLTIRRSVPLVLSGMTTMGMTTMGMTTMGMTTTGGARGMGYTNLRGNLRGRMNSRAGATGLSTPLPGPVVEILPPQEGCALCTWCCTQVVLHCAYHVSASYVAPCNPDRSDSWQAGLEPHFTTGLSVWTHVQVPCLADGTLLAAPAEAAPAAGEGGAPMELLTPLVGYTLHTWTGYTCTREHAELSALWMRQQAERDQAG
jgi:hypothetical protein